MSPYPLDPVRAVGPLRLVITTFPSREAARLATERAVATRLAACGTMVGATSAYQWQGKIETAEEVLVLFKTVPKRVGALFRFLETTHPYEVPEILEIDVPRVGAAYLRYLATTLDPSAPPPPLGGGPTRRGAPQARAARAPRRTRAPHRRRSR